MPTSPTTAALSAGEYARKTEGFSYDECLRLLLQLRTGDGIGPGGGGRHAEHGASMVMSNVKKRGEIVRQRRASIVQERAKVHRRSIVMRDQKTEISKLRQQLTKNEISQLTFLIHEGANTKTAARNKAEQARRRGSGEDGIAVLDDETIMAESKLPRSVRHTYHPLHECKLVVLKRPHACNICSVYIQPGGMTFQCAEGCDFDACQCCGAGVTRDQMVQLVATLCGDHCTATMDRIKRLCAQATDAPRIAHPTSGSNNSGADSTKKEGGQSEAHDIGWAQVRRKMNARERQGERERDGVMQ